MTTTQEIRDLYDEHIRRNTNDSGGVCDAENGVYRCRWDERGFGMVAYADIDADAVDTAIAAQIANFQQHNLPFEWKYHDYDSPPNLTQRLIAHGFEPEQPEAIMALDVARASANLLAPITHDIRKITDLADVRDADTVRQQVWASEPDTVTKHINYMWQLDPESVSLYVAYVDEKPVAYGRIEFGLDESNPFAGIWAGSTIPAFRRRGIYTDLVAIRLQEAIARGRKYLTIDADPMTSMPIVRKYGFHTIAFATPYHWSPDNKT